MFKRNFNRLTLVFNVKYRIPDKIDWNGRAEWRFHFLDLWVKRNKLIERTKLLLRIFLYRSALESVKCSVVRMWIDFSFFFFLFLLPLLFLPLSFSFLLISTFVSPCIPLFLPSTIFLSTFVSSRYTQISHCGEDDEILFRYFKHEILSYASNIYWSILFNDNV